MKLDYEIIKGPASNECNVLAPALCQIVNADPYTLVLIIWAALQLTWVTMLLFVQLVQVSRATTTWENMKGSHGGHHSSRASEAITSALTTGTLSQSSAQIGNTGLGPDPALPPTHAPGHNHHHKAGCFDQWKKILGVDTFVDVALQGSKKQARQARNPFSNGCLGNCKDFWCDPAPIFGKRENGSAMLGGKRVDYTSMYETPRMMSIRRRGGDAQYESLPAGDDNV